MTYQATVPPASIDAAQPRNSMTFRYDATSFARFGCPACHRRLKIPRALLEQSRNPLCPHCRVTVDINHLRIPQVPSADETSANGASVPIVSTGALPTAISTRNHEALPPPIIEEGRNFDSAQARDGYCHLVWRHRRISIPAFVGSFLLTVMIAGGIAMRRPPNAELNTLSTSRTPESEVTQLLRDDAIKLEDELDLLRGEVQRIEGENAQLEGDRQELEREVKNLKQEVI